MQSSNGSITAWFSKSARDPEHRGIRRDPPQLLGARVRSYAAKELAHLPLPAAQIGLQDRRLVFVADLDRAEVFGATADQQAPGPRHAEVADPLGVTTGSDQIPLPVELQKVHRRPP